MICDEMQGDTQGDTQCDTRHIRQGSFIEQKLTLSEKKNIKFSNRLYREGALFTLIQTSHVDVIVPYIASILKQPYMFHIILLYAVILKHYDLIKHLAELKLKINIKHDINFNNGIILWEALYDRYKYNPNMDDAEFCDPSSDSCMLIGYLMTHFNIRPLPEHVKYIEGYYSLIYEKADSDALYQIFKNH